MSFKNSGCFYPLGFVLKLLMGTGSNKEDRRKKR